MSDLAALIHNPSWQWLKEVCHQLNIAIELVDRRLTPLLHLAGERSGSRAHTLVARFPDSPLPPVIEETFESGAPKNVTVAGVALLCMPIAYRDQNAGVLVLADDVVRHQTEAGAHAELARIGSALVSAMSTQLHTPSADAPAEVYRLSNLHRLLRQAVVTGSDREVLRAFIEALAVWRDLEAWAYRSDVTGRFTSDVSLPGSDQTLVPHVLRRDPLRDGVAMTRLSAAERDALGFGSRGEVIVARVRQRTDVDWLLAITGAFEPLLESQLTLYLDALAQALDETAAIEASRLTWAMLQHLVDGADLARRALKGAVTELEFVTDSTARVMLARVDGAPVLSLRDGGEPPVAAGARVAIDAHRLVEVVPIGTAYTFTVVLQRPAGRRFARREERLLRSAIAAIAPWLETIAPRLSPPLDARRVKSRSFEELIAEREDDPTLRPQGVAVLVVSFGEAVPPIDVARELVGRVRGQLRDTDLAGRLMDGDIGVLLLDTPVEGAAAVAERIRRLIAAASPAPGRRHVAVGIAALAAGGERTQSLVVQARANARTTTLAEPAENRPDLH